MITNDELGTPIGVEITLDIKGLSRMKTTFEREVSIKDYVHYIWKTDDVTFGAWLPKKSNIKDTYMSNKRHITRWEKQVDSESIINAMNEASLHASIENLSKFKKLDTSALDLGGLIDVTIGDNWLGYWDTLLRLDPTINPSDRDPRDGELIADMIINDLPLGNSDLRNWVAVLNDYQIGIDYDYMPYDAVLEEIKPVKLITLSDESDSTYQVDSHIEFDYEVPHQPASTQRIGCRYRRQGKSDGEVIKGSTGDVKWVENPVNSQRLALLEISLQRSKLMLNEHKATMVIDLDYRVNPNDTIEYKDRKWKVLTVKHKVDPEAPNTTTLNLRAIISQPIRDV